MIDRVIDFSARHRALVLSLVAAAGILGWWSMKSVPLDAIPDLNDTQVIVYSRWERDPQVVDAQITYPIVSAMLGAPRVKSVRGFSDFGYSFVYVVFKDGTDIYWARSRVVEYLSSVTTGLPTGVNTYCRTALAGTIWRT
jgi:copper/silver efflux system protein